MTHPPAPPPYQPVPPPIHVPRPTNGWAVASLVLGIVTLLICWIPFVNLVGVFTGLSGVGTGIAGLVVSGRRRRGAVMASIGTGLCVLGMALALVITVVVGKAILDGVGSDDDVPSTSAEVGDLVTSGSVDFRVVSVGDCVDSPGTSTAASCPISFEVHNNGTASVSIGEDDVAAVVDGSYERVVLYDDETTSYAYRVGAGSTRTIDTSVLTSDGSDVVEAIFFDTDGRVRDGGGVGVAVVEDP